MNKSSQILKIKNLISLSKNNPNLNEASASWAIAQKLMLKYNISQAEVESHNPSRKIYNIKYYDTIWDIVDFYNFYTQDIRTNNPNQDWLKYSQVGDKVYCTKEKKFATIHEKFTKKDNIRDNIGYVKLKFDDGNIQDWMLRPDGTGIDYSICLEYC